MAAKILVVDDDPDLLELLRNALTAAGHRIETALSGTEALVKAERSAPDCVVLDLLLPDVSGFNVCETLRRLHATASVPVVMMTVLTGEFPRLVGVEAGADAYINKPFEIDEMVRRVGELLRDRRVTGTSHRQVRGQAA